VTKDPFGFWSPRQRLLWLGLTAVVCAVWGPSFVERLRPPHEPVRDFFQEWASARNFWSGLPIYAEQSDSVERYLGYRPQEPFYYRYNAHPPSSVLLALPFAALDYQNAGLAWNLFSLACLAACVVIVVRQLGIPWTWWNVLPLVTLLLVCNPLRSQTHQGQLNLVLLLLLTGMWAADRSDRPLLAGILLGVATAAKLVPGLFFLTFLVRKEWKTVTAGVFSFSALTLVTAGVLGIDAYRDYVRDVMPHVQIFRDWWLNASLLGFWSRLFDGRSGQVDVVVQQPSLALALTIAWAALVLVLLVSRVRRTRTPEQKDIDFGLSCVAMLLLSPVAWDHYFCLLLVPMALWWLRLPADGSLRAWFLLLLAVSWINPKVLWDATIGEFGSSVATPWQTLTVLAFLTYTLIGLFALGLALHRKAA
jgi:hypothetical protein